MLAYEDVKSRLTRIFRDVFDDDGIEIFDEMTAADLDGWDSLSQITLTLSAEREFRLKFTTDEIANMTNVGDFIKAICARG